MGLNKKNKLQLKIIMQIKKQQSQNANNYCNKPQNNCF